MKIGIVEPQDFSNKAQNYLLSIGTIAMFDETNGSLENFICDKDVLFVRLKYFYNEKLLCKAEKLKFICSTLATRSRL